MSFYRAARISTILLLFFGIFGSQGAAHSMHMSSGAMMLPVSSGEQLDDCKDECLPTEDLDSCIRHCLEQKEAGVVAQSDYGSAHRAVYFSDGVQAETFLGGNVKLIADSPPRRSSVLSTILKIQKRE